MNPCGSAWLNGSQILYTVTIYNYGTADADTMVSETVATRNGSLLAVAGVYVDGDSIIYTMNQATNGLTFSRIVVAQDNYTLQVFLQPGCNPGRLTLIAMSDLHGPFNDLIIGPPYARPSLAISRAAPPGPGTNAVALAISSDAETLQFQYTDSLAPTNWTGLARLAVTGAITVLTDTNSAPTRFYRALVPIP